MRAAVLRAIVGGWRYDVARGSGSVPQADAAVGLLLHVSGRRVGPASSRPGPEFFIAATAVLALSLVPVMVCFWPARRRFARPSDRAMPELCARTALEALFRASASSTTSTSRAARSKSSAISVRTDRARRRRRACWPACSSHRAASSSTTARDIRDDLRRLSPPPWLHPGRAVSLSVSVRPRIPATGRTPARTARDAAHQQDRRLPAAVQSQRRGRSEHRLVFERHAAEDRHFRGAAARPGRS